MYFAVEKKIRIKKKKKYYVYHILKQEKVLFCIMNSDVDVVTLSISF